MSTFFQNFPQVEYSFGNSLPTVLFQNLTTYVDLIDRIRDNVSFYRKYYILEGDRPDQVSHKLYGTTDYHWTFFLLNDHLRLQGWPLTETELKHLAEDTFPNTVLTTGDELTGIFKVGQTVRGSTSGTTGTITHRNLDLGQIHIEGSKTFNNSEVITSQVGEDVQSVQLTRAIDEVNAIRYYVDGDGNPSDIDPLTDSDGSISAGSLTPVTNIEFYRASNDELKAISIIRPDVIRDVVRDFEEALS